MMRHHLKYLSILFSFVATGAVATEFRHAGEWVADCRKKGVQCWWDIELTGKDEEFGSNKYNFRFTVADRLNASKVHCTIEGHGFSDALPIGQGVVAYMGPKKIEVHMRESDDGSLFAFTPKGDDLGCKGADALGDLDPVGH